MRKILDHGFRPGGQAHDALDALCVGITSRKVNSILDADIQSLSQEWLIRFVEHRIGDKRIIRQVQKWLKAGVLEDGVVMGSDRRPAMRRRSATLVSAGAKPT